MTAPQESTFGLELYEQLKRQPGSDVFSGRLNYAQIQHLKAASRAQVVEMFRGSTDYQAVQHIKQDSARDLAESLVRRAQLRRPSGASSNIALLVMLGVVLDD